MKMLKIVGQKISQLVSCLTQKCHKLVKDGAKSKTEVMKKSSLLK